MHQVQAFRDGTVGLYPVRLSSLPGHLVVLREQQSGSRAASNKLNACMGIWT